MKYHIEKNTVQETLVIPLYARKMCSELFGHIYTDQTAVRLITQMDYDFSTLEKMQKAPCSNLDFWRSLCGRQTLHGRCVII